MPQSFKCPGIEKELVSEDIYPTVPWVWFFVLLQLPVHSCNSLGAFGQQSGLDYPRTKWLPLPSSLPPLKLYPQFLYNLSFRLTFLLGKAEDMTWLFLQSLECFGIIENGLRAQS